VANDPPSAAKTNVDPREAFAAYEPIPEALTDGRVRLRRYRPEDAQAMHAAALESHREVGPFLTFCREHYPLEEAREWARQQHEAWAERSSFEMVVEEIETGRFLGSMGLNQIETLNRAANLGYWIRTSATGRGVATAAGGLALRLAFEHLGLVRVGIYGSVENTASLRVAEKLGAQREGVMRKRLLLHGRHHDAALYSILLEDWRQAR
jgi:RimJ/RimL family protein N-acetyltransferase